MSLGKRLKKEREKRKWSQLYVAEKIGITNTVLSNYERDYRDPDTETLKKLAELYEVSTDYLLGRTDDPHPTEEDKLDEEIRKIMDDPETGIFFKDYLSAPEEKRKQLRDFMKFLLEQEKDRKPGDKQEG